MTTRELRKTANKSTIYIKYIDNENNTSDGLYAIKINSNRWQVGTAILSNKKIFSIYNKIETIINNNQKREGFQYWTNNNNK